MANYKLSKFSVVEVKKVVLITGGTNGLGWAITFQLAKLGAKLAIVGRKEEHLRRIVEACEQTTGLKPLVILADINHELDIKRIIQETTDHYGRIDLLVNNAGILYTGGIKNTPMGMFDKVMNNNIRSVYQLTKLALPYLIKSKGSIINIPAPTPTQPDTINVIYNMTKVALNNFSRSIAYELRQDGVTVNSVNPSFVRPAEVGTGEQDLMFSTAVTFRSRQVPTKGQEIAGLIAFLASDRGKCITGATFVLGLDN